MRLWLNDLKQLYKIINGLVPIALPDYITFAEATQSRHTRGTAAIIGGFDTTTLYCNIRPNCDAFRDGFFYRALKAWNNLPVDIRQAEGVSSFKGKLIDHIFELHWKVYFSHSLRLMFNLYSTCSAIFVCLFHSILNFITYFDFTGPDVLWFCTMFRAPG